MKNQRQSRKGYSLTEFLKAYGTQQKCQTALTLSIMLCNRHGLEVWSEPFNKFNDKTIQGCVAVFHGHGRLLRDLLHGGIGRLLCRVAGSIARRQALCIEKMVLRIAGAKRCII